MSLVSMNKAIPCMKLGSRHHERGHHLAYSPSSSNNVWDDAYCLGTKPNYQSSEILDSEMREKVKTYSFAASTCVSLLLFPSFSFLSWFTRKHMVHIFTLRYFFFFKILYLLFISCFGTYFLLFFSFFACFDLIFFYNCQDF